VGKIGSLGEYHKIVPNGKIKVNTPIIGDKNFPRQNIKWEKKLIFRQLPFNNGVKIKFPVGLIPQIPIKLLGPGF